MKVKKTDSTQKTRSHKRSFDSFHIFVIITIVFVILLFFLWQQNLFDAFSYRSDSQERTLSNEITIPAPEPLITSSSSGSTSVNSIDANPSPTSITGNETTEYSNGNPIASSIALPEKTIGTSSSQPTNLSYVSKEPLHDQNSQRENGYLQNTCGESARIIKDFYRHLDSQEYLRPYSLSGASEQHFTKLIQRLLNTPPIVSGEMNDLFTILQNTAHFFRIIGKNNILILKGILDREKDQFEYVLDHFYSLLQIPACSEKSFNLKIPEESLTDYAGFFLNTMGGRLYLFRRDSMSRMVVSFYAILLIDQANSEGRNKHGIEIKTAIDQLINEIESTSNHLLLKEKYLDNLYSLKEQYQ